MLPRGRGFSVGSEIHLHCNVTGEPAPSVMWYKDNREIETSDHVELPGMNEILVYFCT